MDDSTKNCLCKIRFRALGFYIQQVWATRDVHCLRSIILLPTTLPQRTLTNPFQLLKMTRTLNNNPRCRLDSVTRDVWGDGGRLVLLSEAGSRGSGLSRV